MRAKRRVAPWDPARPVIVRLTNSGAESDTTPMAIRPRAKMTARSLPSINRIVREQPSAATKTASFLAATAHNAAILPKAWAVVEESATCC
jgi:hypothetical protein